MKVTSELACDLFVDMQVRKDYLICNKYYIIKRLFIFGLDLFT